MLFRHRLHEVKHTRLQRNRTDRTNILRADFCLLSLIGNQLLQLAIQVFHIMIHCLQKEI